MAKATTEDYRSIDIRRWERKGLLLPECKWNWSWRNDDGKEVSKINVETQLSRVVLRYSAVGPGGEWDPIEDPISLDRTYILGRQRLWFLCPSCDKRVAILYLKKYYFRCRRCLGLVYQSQKVTPSQRALRRMRETA